MTCSFFGFDLLLLFFFFLFFLDNDSSAKGLPAPSIVYAVRCELRPWSRKFESTCRRFAECLLIDFYVR